MSEVSIEVYCPCGAYLTTYYVPSSWQGESRATWQICSSCGKKVAHKHNGYSYRSWYVNENSSSYNNDDNDNGSGGCFITTAVCDSFGKADDCYELSTFRNFRDNWLTLQNDGKNLITEYYQIAPKIVEKINQLPNAAKIYKNIWNDYLKNCLNFIERGENQKCKEIYISMVKNLKSKFLG